MAGSGLDFDLEAQGFLGYEHLRERVLRGGSSALPYTDEPALVVVSVGEGGGAKVSDSLAYCRTLDGQGGESEGGGDPRAYADRVAFLRKRPGNPFPQMISVGRARNSDVVIALGTVSKVQCYFIREADGWAVVDQRSKNGTFVGGEAVAPGTRRPLQDGDRIRFGEDLVLEFCTRARLIRGFESR